MKKEDIKYFSSKMKEMADIFNQATLCRRPDVKASIGPAFEVDKQLANKANKFAENLYAEFKAAGYNEQEWETLMKTSGAKKKLDKLGL